jgi:hypothetical protein
VNRLVLVVAAALPLVACRNLSYPTEDGGVLNKPPVVSFVTPAMDQLVPAVPVVQVSARDANGIADVTLSCGGGPLYVWTAAPFQASVDLSHCPPAGDGGWHENPGGPGFREVALTAVARDTLFAASAPVSVHVRIDLSMAQLTVQMPERGVPGRSLSLRITSDRPLGALPTANLGSLAAQVYERVDLEPAGSPLTVFDAWLWPLPGLGTDLYDGGTGDIPIEVLEQVERPQLVEIEGRAPNGNVTRTVLQFLLSRVAWQRSIVGHYEPSTYGETAPVATDTGLVVPMAVSSGWLPAYYSHETGTFTAFGAAGLRDAGYTLNGIDDQGRTLLSMEIGGPMPLTQYVYVTGPSSVSGTFTTGQLITSDYARVGDGLCQEATIGGGCAGSFSRSLVCLTPDGEESSYMAVHPQDSQKTNPELTTTSAGVYWATRYSEGFCTGLRPVTFVATPGWNAAVIAGDLSELEPAMMTSFENGSVALTARSITGRWGTKVVDPNGTVTPGFFTDQAAVEMGLSADGGVPPANIVAGRPDGTLVTLHYEDPYTVFTLWWPGGMKVGDFQIPGYYIGTDSSTSPVQPPDRSVGVDSSLAVVLVAGSPGPGQPGGQDVILFIDPQFQPRWLYRTGASSGRLVANRNWSNLYYVDATLQRITALAR